MRRGSLSTFAGMASAVLAAIVLPAALALPAKDEVLQFRTPSGNIGCVYAHFDADETQGLPATLRCDIRSGLKPRPRRPKGCDLDWGDSLAMSKRSRVSAVCHGDTALGADRVLRYGRTWRHDGFTCVSRKTGLTCTNLAKHGFFLSRETWRRF